MHDDMKVGDMSNEFVEDRKQEEPSSPVELVLYKVGGLAALPQVVCQIMEMTGSDEACIKRIDQAIQVDPGLSARLLAHANSAYYALPNKVTSIREAIMFLGFKGVREIAMAVGVFDMFLGKTDKESLRRRAWWKHSLNAAMIGRAMSEKIPKLKADEVYTCALLHLIGKTILDRYNPTEYERVQTVVEQGAPDILAERAVFHCDHISVNIGAAQKWGFPEVLIMGLDYFSPKVDRSAENSLRAMVGFCTRIAKLVVQDRIPQDVSSQHFPGWILDSLELTDNLLGDLVSIGFGALEDASSMMF